MGVSGYQPGLGDQVRLRKPHACGGSTWRVVRLGADIGLVCAGCGKRVLLARAEFNKQLKDVLSAAVDEQPRGMTP
jgi:hypothetical protein